MIGGERRLVGRLLLAAALVLGPSPAAMAHAERPPADASPGGATLAAPILQLAQTRGGSSANRAPARGSSAQLKGGSSADRYGGSSADRAGVAGPRGPRTGSRSRARRQNYSRSLNQHPLEAPEEGQAREERESR